MADKKNTVKNKQSVNKQTTRKTDNNKKTVSASKSGKTENLKTSKSQSNKQSKSAEQTVVIGNSKIQLAAVIICVVAFIMGSIVFISGKDGTLWDGIRGTVFGFFGWTGFIIPFVLIYISIMMTYDKMVKNIGVKIVQGFLLFILLGSFVFVNSHPEEINFLSDIKNEFVMFFELKKYGNGLFSAIIGECLYALGNSKSVAYSIILISIFADFMFFTGFTLIRLIKLMSQPVKKVAEIQKNQMEKYSDDYDRPRRMFGFFNQSVFDDEENENDLHNKNNESSSYKITDFDENDALPANEDGEIRNIFDIKSKNTAVDDNDKDISPEDIFKIDDKNGKPNIYLPNDEEFDKSLKDNFDEEIPVDVTGERTDEKLSKKDIEKGKNEISDEMEKQNVVIVDNYKLPSFNLLNPPPKNTRSASQADLKAVADKLMSALHSFNVEGTVTEIVPGPSVTRFEVAPAPGVKISKFTNLADDLTLHLAAPAGIRIEAPIPNKSAIGIEIPNRGRATVSMKEIVTSDVFRNAKGKLNVALGKDITGNVICCDIAKMPHLLIAGTTGSGKSVCLNAMITSVLFNAKPSEVKLLLIDPKQVEFSNYNGVPHLLVPVVSEARKAAGALGWAVTEMLNRYSTLNEYKVKDITAYNNFCDTTKGHEKMCHIMIVIDELSDLMAVAPSEVENSIMRLAQMARAAGMHLVVATQRPSVDVITGLIKANIPSRIALSVSSQIDSRTILDTAGAEKLLGLGDMLYAPAGTTKPVRVQGCFLSDEEIERVVDFVKHQESTAYNEAIQEEIDKNALNTAPKRGSKDSESGSDGKMSNSDNEIVMKAAELCIKNPEKASISAFQRNLSLGFAKAGRIMDALEKKGVVGPSQGSKPRKVLLTLNQWYEMNAMQPNVPGDDDSPEDDGDE